MIPRSVKAPTIPIPFHKLLKVVAVVDRDNAQTKAAAGPDPRRGLRGRGLRPLRPRPGRGRLGRRLHRAGRRRAPRAGARSGRARCARSASGRRCGRWPIRTASPTWPVLGMVGEVDGFIYLGQQTPEFYAKQVIASAGGLRPVAAAAVLRRADGLRRRGQHRLRLPRPPGRAVLPQVADRADCSSSTSARASSATTCAMPTSTSATC